LWPWEAEHYVARDLVYIFLGVALKFGGVIWFPEEAIPGDIQSAWSQEFPPFGWSRKLRQFFIRNLHFVAFMFTWVGSWDTFDLYLYHCGYCWRREIWYITVPMLLLFVSQEVLSKDTLYWIAVKLVGSNTRHSIPPSKRYSTV